MMCVRKNIGSGSHGLYSQFDHEVVSELAYSEYWSYSVTKFDDISRIHRGRRKGFWLIAIDLALSGKRTDVGEWLAPMPFI